MQSTRRFADPRFDRPPLRSRCERWGALLLGLILLLGGTNIESAEPDPFPAIPRRLPPPGMELDAEVREALQQRLAKLQTRLLAHRVHPQEADVAVLLKAVDYALRLGEFYGKADVAKADSLLDLAQQRLAVFDAKEAPPWLQQEGLVVRGYRSSIDGSPQPYGLEIPAGLQLDRPVPLYVWLHGRGDKTTDMHFLDQRRKRPGRIAPAGAIVVHPFGRQCIGFKSAGERDVLEVVEQVQANYKIDDQRIALMGFSMGGAGAWHVGAHYPNRWVAVSPGAGFAETALYNRLSKEQYPPPYEQSLWGTYDVPCYVRNLFNLPVIAYSGEVDKQIQAARVMEAAYKGEGRELPHLIGPKTAHKYEPQTLAELMKQMSRHVAKGRDVKPQHVFLQTRTLRYHRAGWVQALGLKKHWQDSRIDATLTNDSQLEITTRNVTRLRLTPWQESRVKTTIVIDQQELSVDGPTAMPAVTLKLEEGRWQVDASPSDSALRKRPGLQGPIDDAFLDPFLVVTPSGKSKHPAVAKWVDFELDRLRERWRALYRGELPEKPDHAVTPEDLASRHVILFGTPTSNRVLQRVLSVSKNPLPLKWNDQTLQLGSHQVAADRHVPVLVFPNPLQPDRYVVLNSGPTFREEHDRTNSLQNPKLPDWALLDLSQPPNGVQAGKVVAADFFNESWQP